MTLFEVRGLFAGYDGEDTLRDVSLEVERGEVLTVMGPNGAGKTTLLGAMNGRHPPSGGEVVFDGDDLYSSRGKRLEARRRMGYVSQENSLFDDTVRGNAEYGLRVRRTVAENVLDRATSLLGGESIHGERVTEVLESVGLASIAERPAGDLSGGERRRLALARALAPGPDALLLDEVTVNLDPRNVAIVENLIRDEAAGGVAAVIATHDVGQAARVSDRVAVILGGDVAVSGAVDEVLSGSGDADVDGFLDGELVY